MWPFASKSRVIPSVTPPPGLEERCGALERRNAELAADLALLRREWADTLDKLQTWFGRQAARKRQQLHRDLETAEEKAQDPVRDTNGGGAMTKADLRRIAAQRFTRRG